MITELALATALSMTGTAFGHSFNYEFLPTKSFYEAQITVDPTTGTQAGWLGFENFTPNLVQVGWLSYGGNLTAFYQVWANGVITDTGTLGPELTPGSVIDVAVSTDNRNQWLLWAKVETKWKVVWMGDDPLTLANGIWVISTESIGTAAVPALHYTIKE